MTDTIALNTKTNSKEAQELENKFNAILEELKQVSSDRKQYNQGFNERIKKIDAKLESALIDAEKLSDELQDVETANDNDLDSLILNQIKDLSESE